MDHILGKPRDENFGFLHARGDQIGERGLLRHIAAANLYARGITDPSTAEVEREIDRQLEEIRTELALRRLRELGQG